MNRLNLSFRTLTLVGTLLASLASVALYADILTLNNGDELFGQVKTIASSVLLIDRNGIVSSYTFDQIMKLEFETLKMPEGEDTVERVKDPLIQELLKAVPTADQFPQATRLDVLDEEIIELRSPGTWDYTARQVFVPFKEVARDDANHSFGYFPDLERAEVIYGRSITPPERGLMGLVGGKPGSVRYVSDHTIADEADHGTIPMYQRKNTVKFAIPEVMMGTIVDRQYRVTRTKDDPLQPFLWEKAFRGREPARIIRLVVRAPRSIDLVFQILGPGGIVRVETIEKDNMNEWRFESRDGDGMIDEPLMPSLERMVPRVVIGLKDTWAGVAERYETCLAPLRRQALADPTVEAEVARICSGTVDPAEKARRLFGFLARDIGDVDIFPDGYSWKPHAASELLKAKQANQLDRAFLFHCLLLKAGIQNDVYAVRWRDFGEIASDVPSLMQMVGLAVEISPAVASFPIGIPVLRDLGPDITPTWLQGASAVRIPDGKSRLVPFRASDSEGSRAIHEGEIAADGTLRVKTTMLTRGSVAGDWRSMRDYTRKQQEQAIESMLHESIPGTRLLSFKLENLDDTATPPTLEWQWEVASYALRSGDDLMVVPLPTDKRSYSAASVGPAVRRWPLSWGLQRSDEQTISLKLPDGYTIYALPDGGFTSTRGIVYHSRFGFSVNRVLFTDVFERRVTDLEASEYPDYKKMVEGRSQTANQWIVIRRQR